MQDLYVHRLQRRTGIDAELVRQAFANGPVSLEGLVLPAVAVLGKHQLTSDPLIARMGLRCLDKLTEKLRVPARAQGGVVAIQNHGKPLSSKRTTQLIGPGCVDRGQRFAGPHGQGVVEQGQRVYRSLRLPGVANLVPEAVQVQ